MPNFCNKIKNKENMVELPEIKAGFPSPAQDYSENIIDLNRELVKNPASTFFGRAKGESMLDAGISDGDILIIDKSIEPYQDAVRAGSADFTLVHPAAEAAADLQSLFFGDSVLLRERGEHRL